MQVMNNNPIYSQTNKSMTILNNVNDYEDTMTSPSCSIEEIENIFTLCQFDKSLSYANEILLSSSSSSININMNEDENQEEKILMLYYDIPMYFCSNLDLVDTNDTSSLLSSVKSRIFKLGILQTHHRDDDNGGGVDLDFLSIQDRAAIIAIQSSYELWKQRRRNNHDKNDIITSSVSIDSTLQQHIQPFLQLYTTTTSMNNSNNNTHHDRHGRHVNTISLDLLFVWIQFIYTIGLHSTCIEMILHAIDVVFLSMDDIDDDTNNSNNEIEENGRDQSYDESLLDTTQDSIIQRLEDKFNNLQEGYLHHHQRQKHQHQQSSTTSSSSTIHHHDLEIENHNLNDNYNDMIHNQCYNIFHFLLVDILPCIHNKDVLECITNELCILMTKRIFYHYNNYDADLDMNTGTGSSSYKPYFKGIIKKYKVHHNLIGMSKSSTERDDDIQTIISNTEPSLSSITKVYQTIESILNYTKDEVFSLESMMNSTNTTCSTTNMTRSSVVTTMKLIPNFVKECLEQCMEDVYIFQQQELQNNTTTDDKTNSNTTKCIDSDPNENKKLNSIIIDNQEEDYNNTIDEDHTSSPLSMIQDYVINPLWTSEERWMNRGRVLAVGYLTYTMMFQKRRKRRREQVMNLTKKVGNIMISPIKEIISAIQN